MTNVQLKTCLLAMLETVSEFVEVPNDAMYNAFASRLTTDEYQRLVLVATGGDIIQNKNNILSLTEKGQMVMAKIKALKAEQRAAIPI